MLELIHQERQHLDGVDHPDAGQQHLQLHRRVVEHRLLQQLQLHESAALHASHHHQDGLAQQLTRSKPAKMVIGVHFPHVPQAESELLGYNTEVFSPAAAAAADWQQPLADLLTADGRCKYHMSMCQPELIARGAWELDVAVCPQVRKRSLMAPACGTDIHVEQCAEAMTAQCQLFLVYGPGFTSLACISWTINTVCQGFLRSVDSHVVQPGCSWHTLQGMSRTAARQDASVIPRTMLLYGCHQCCAWLPFCPYRTLLMCCIGCPIKPLCTGWHPDPAYSCKTVSLV